MTRLAMTPEEEIRRLARRVEALENQNRLDNASFSGTIRFEDGATILAGEVTILEDGIEFPWGAGRQLLGTVLDAIDNRAQIARDRADYAHDRIDIVSTRSTNALNRADSAHDRIDTVSTRATNALNAANAAQSRADSAYSLAEGRVTQTQRNVIVAKINQIIAVMATEGSNPKPPPIQS